MTGDDPNNPNADPNNWNPGDYIAHRSGGIERLARRKEDDTGWWIEGSGGIGDPFAASGDFLLLTPERVASLFDTSNDALQQVKMDLIPGLMGVVKVAWEVVDAIDGAVTRPERFAAFDRLKVAVDVWLEEGERIASLFDKELT